MSAGAGSRFNLVNNGACQAALSYTRGTNQNHAPSDAKRVDRSGQQRVAAAQRPLLHNRSVASNIDHLRVGGLQTNAGTQPTA